MENRSGSLSLPQNIELESQDHSPKSEILRQAGTTPLQTADERSGSDPEPDAAQARFTLPLEAAAGETQIQPARQSGWNKRRSRIAIVAIALLACAIIGLGMVDMSRDRPPTEAEKYYLEGKTQRAAGRSEEAIQAFQKAISLNPKFTKAHYDLGLSYLDAGDRKGLINQHKILATLDQGLADELYNRIYE